MGGRGRLELKNIHLGRKEEKCPQLTCQTFSPEQSDFKNTSNIKKTEKVTYLKTHDTKKKKKKKQSPLNENKNLKFIMWSLREREQVYNAEKVQGYNNKNTDCDETWIV